jgi:hypothetical protein
MRFFLRYTRLPSHVQILRASLTHPCVRACVCVSGWGGVPVQNARQRLFLGKLQQRARTEKEVAQQWLVRGPWPGRACMRRHACVSLSLWACIVPNSRIGTQAVARTVTQPRALWALPPAFPQWQLDRTEGQSVATRWPRRSSLLNLFDTVWRNRAQSHAATTDPPRARDAFLDPTPWQRRQLSNGSSGSGGRGGRGGADSARVGHGGRPRGQRWRWCWRCRR